MKWREIGEHEHIWTLDQSHPIAQGVEQGFKLDHEEMYGENFDIPAPDDLIFAGWFAGGEVFRSGCVWTRGKGKVFYFQPGHESNPSYYNENVKKIIRNAALWMLNSRV